MGNSNMQNRQSSEEIKAVQEVQAITSPKEKLQLATFGAGCFWCIEAIFQRVRGVESVVSGYAGGEIDNPSYDTVCSGASNHAEVIQVAFDPSEISYKDLLNIFFRVHDPTTYHKQGNDVGSQYRSIILYHDEEQKHVAEEVKSGLSKERVILSEIVTEIVPLVKFYPAEKYHQDYYNNNSATGYCAFVIKPKLDKYAKFFEKKDVSSV